MQHLAILSDLPLSVHFVNLHPEDQLSDPIRLQALFEALPGEKLVTRHLKEGTQLVTVFNLVIRINIVSPFHMNSYYSTATKL